MIKKILLGIFLSTGVVFQACSEDDFGGEKNLNSVNFSARIKYDENFDSKNANNAIVILKNSESGTIYEGTTSTEGVANFTNILPGNYQVTVSKNMTAKEFLETFLFPASSDEVHFNGSQENVTVNANATSTEIKLKSGLFSDLVIKQIYYAGSSAKEGAIFRDQFVELYNNSAEVVYADGYLFAQLTGNVNNKSESYTQAGTNQWDWSKSEDNNKGDAANTDYVYATNVYRIPGSGLDHPILPGKSIVIAATAINHKGNYTDNSGKVVEIKNPDLTLDLSNADFEAYLGTYLGTAYKYDIQNPSVPDLEIVHWATNQDMVLDPLGRNAYIIFKTSNEEIKKWTTYRTPNKASLSYNLRYLQIPNTVILDGLDTTTDLNNKLIPKKLRDFVDAGRVYMKNGSYSSYSTNRKIKTTINGRVILQDTNNSANDFEEKRAELNRF